MMVLGSGPLADAMRAEIERDPDKYKPETWSIDPVGHCPCCDQDVFRCTTRHTKWVEGFATHGNVVHPCLSSSGEPMPSAAGAFAGCCCVAPNWGPKHLPDGPIAAMKPARRKRKRST